MWNYKYVYTGRYINITKPNDFWCNMTIRYPIFYWLSIGTDSLFFKILDSKRIEVTSLTFLGHVTDDMNGFPENEIFHHGLFDSP